MDVWSTREIAEKARAEGKSLTQAYVRRLSKRGINPAGDFIWPGLIKNGPRNATGTHRACG